MTTDAQPLTLTDFLLARVAEDETIARQYEHWLANTPTSGSWAVLARATRNQPFDPTRVLAECKAKYVLVQVHNKMAAEIAAASADSDDSKASRYRDILTGLTAALTELARPYSDHADYQLEWKGSAPHFG